MEARRAPQLVRDGAEHAVAVARHHVHLQAQLGQPPLQPPLLCTQELGLDLSKMLRFKPSTMSYSDKLLARHFVKMAWSIQFITLHRINM